MVGGKLAISKYIGHIVKVDDLNIEIPSVFITTPRCSGLLKKVRLCLSIVTVDDSE